MSKRWLRYGLWVTLMTGLIVVSAASAYGAWWYHRGGRILSVQTGSMRPTFAPGDGVIMQPVSFDQLRSGDVVSYKNAQNPAVVVSHRVVSVQHGRRRLITQGDRLRYPDPAVQQWQIIGRVSAVAPGYGSVLHWLRRPVGLAIAVYIPMCLVIGYEMWAVYRTQRQTAIYRLRSH